MATQGSKGLTKRHSALQKEHYKSHPFRLEKNRKRKLARHIRRNLKKAEKRGTNIDKQARDAYKRIVGVEWQQ